MNIYRIETLEDLWKTAVEARAELAGRAKDMRMTNEADEPVWFRGHAKATYILQPSLFRTANGVHAEGRLYHEYRAFKPKLTGWETLFHMQHYLVPTRLLDWTTDFGTALYFALNDDDCDVPSLYVLHPCLLNHEAFKVYTSVMPSFFPLYPDEPRGEARGCPVRYPRDYGGNGQWAHASPIALQPGIHNERILAQSSVFTIHGSDQRPIESQCADCLVKLELHLKANKIQLLRDLGRRSRDIFPDETGMSLTLRNQFGLKPIPHKETTIEEAIVRIWKEDEGILRGQTTGKLHMEGLADCKVGPGYFNRANTSDEIRNWLDDNDRKVPLAIVLGPAASGKTNFVINFVLDNKAHFNRVFLYCRLNDFKPREQTLGEFLATSLAEMARGKDGDDKKEWIDELALQVMVSDGRVVLILDGLDELVRIQGEESATYLGSQIRRLNKRGAGRARIIVACRDHIVRNLEGKVDSLVKDVGRIPLDDIPARLISNKWGVDDRVAAVVASVPLLCRVLDLVADPKSIKNKSDLWSRWLDAAGRRLAKPLQRPELLNSLGKIATLMLKRRDDFLLEGQLDAIPELKELVEGLGNRDQNPCPLFAEEVDGKWRFTHQAIREYVLASNILYGFDNPESVNVLTSTSALDYESAETYICLQDLLEDSLKHGRHMPTRYFRSQIEMQDNDKWNNFARNYFEALGMLGVRNEAERDKGIRQALEVIAAGTEVRSKTKYNAARCLTRLHPTSPPDYCEWASRPSWPEIDDGKCVVVYGYAVRGFHQTRLKVDRRPVEVFRRELADVEGESKYKSWSKQVSTRCLDQIEELASKPVLSVGERFLQINCAHALIRWLNARQPRVLARTRKLVDKRTVRREARMNLFLALCVHGCQPEGTEQFLAAEIDGRPRMKNHFDGDITRLCGPEEDDSMEDDN
jgi:hypothetical protein